MPEKTINIPEVKSLKSHFRVNDSIKDIIIGMSDGLTVPFALAAGISAVASTKIVVTAGLAEIAAGAISMGLGGFLAARSEVEYYQKQRLKEQKEVIDVPDLEEQEIYDIMGKYGVNRDAAIPIVESLKADHKMWVDFMMKFELELKEPDDMRAIISGFTIGGSYVIGGLIPLIPYMLFQTTSEGLKYSIASTLIALIFFGVFKGRYSNKSPWASGLETMFIGGIAAAAAYLMAKLIS